MARSRVKLGLIANKTARKTTFKKRKRVVVKKVNELATLCGVKACVVIDSCYDSNPEAWPSREGVEDVYSKFMEFPERERTKKMYDQESYTWERIKKEQAQVKRLRDENRESELREFMFDLFKGKMMMEDQYYDASVIQELRIFIDHYINKLTHRIQILQASGESNFFPLPPALGDVNPAVVATAASVTNPIEFYDHIHQYQDMNMSVNQQAPANFNDLIHHQNMNHQEQCQYQTPANFYDQNQHSFYDSSQDMHTYLNHNQRQSSNQYPNLHQPFMNELMTQSQQMSYDQELASIASMDDNYNLTHQLSTTSHMPFITTTTTTTTTTADLSTHSINNNLWPTRIGLG